MINKIDIYCKRDFIRYGKILFHKNKKYYYYTNSREYVFIYYDEDNIDVCLRGYTLYFEEDPYYKEDNSKIYDFFYKLEEEVYFHRKEKLKNLKKYNEVRNT